MIRQFDLMDTDIFEMLQKKEFIRYQIEETLKEKNHGYLGLEYHRHIIYLHFELLLL